MMPVSVLSLCGPHVISSEPHGVMVSTHVSGFMLLKLEFLFWGANLWGWGVWSSRNKGDNWMFKKNLINCIHKKRAKYFFGGYLLALLYQLLYSPLFLCG